MIATSFSQHLTDEQLVVLLKQSNRNAFNEIYQRYWKKLFLSAYKRVRSVEDTKDMVQDLFASLWLKRHTIEIKEALSSYLYTAVKYKVLNYIESRIVRKNYVTYRTKSTQDYDNSTSEGIISNELQALLEKEINNLSPKVKEAFELSRNENLSIKEIAQKMNVSDQTVKNQISTALKTIRFNLASLM